MRPWRGPFKGIPDPNEAPTRSVSQPSREIRRQRPVLAADPLPGERGDEVGGAAGVRAVEQAEGMGEVAGERLGADAGGAQGAQGEGGVALRELAAAGVEQQ